MSYRPSLLLALAALLASAACDASSRRDDRRGFEGRADRFDDDDSDDGDASPPDDDDDDGALPGAGDDDAWPGTGDDDDAPPPPAPETPTPPPVPVDDCADLPAAGTCDGDVAIACADEQRVETDCASYGTTCGFVDGAATCVSETIALIDRETPAYVCGDFVMMIGGGAVYTEDVAGVVVEGRYDVRSDGLAFDVPGRLVGVTVDEIVAASMLLGFYVGDRYCGAVGYEFVDGVDASFDCGTATWYGGSFMDEMDFTLTAYGQVYRTTTTETGVDTTYAEDFGVYRREGDLIFMAFSEDDATRVIEAELRADGTLYVPTFEQPSCARETL